MSSKTTSFNKTLYFEKEISHTGTSATVKLLRSPGVKALNGIGRIFAYSSTRSYGSFMLSFGLLSIFLHLGNYYFSDEPQVAPQLLIGSILVLLSIPFLCFDRPMCVALQDFPLTDYILFEFLSIKRMHRNDNQATVPPLLALFLGFIPAIVGFFVPLQYVAAVMLVIVIGTGALTTPEFSVILTLLLLPYLPILPRPNVILTAISALSFLSFAIKLLLGKRVFNFDIYSALLIATFTVVLIGGALGGYISFRNSVRVILLALGFFPASNLIINRRLADCAVNAIIVSSVPPSIVAIFQFFLRKPATAGFFADPSVLAAYLIVSATLALSFVIQKHHVAKKAAYLSIFLVEIFTLGLIMQPIIWITFVLGAAAYFILTSRQTPAHLVIPLLFAPYLVLLIPNEKMEALFSALNLSPGYAEKISGYQNALSAFFKNPRFFSGIGSTTSAMPSPSAGPVSLNAALGVGLSFGILTLALLAITILLHIHHVYYYRHYVRHSYVKVTSGMAVLSIVALLIYATDSYVFDSSSIIYLFFSMLAISTAALRIAKKESEDKFFYYDESNVDSSALDVEIR